MIDALRRWRIAYAYLYVYDLARHDSTSVGSGGVCGVDAGYLTGFVWMREAGAGRNKQSAVEAKPGGRYLFMLIVKANDVWARASDAVPAGASITTGADSG